MNTSPCLCKEYDFQLIADEGFLTSLFLPDFSLQGMTGAALFFALTAQKNQDSGYSNFAEILLEKMCESLTLHLPVGLSYGLCGIGWRLPNPMPLAAFISLQPTCQKRKM